MGNLKLVIYIAVSLSYVSSNKPPENCIPKNIDRLCRQNKCGGVSNFSNCENLVSPYLGGNQCCNQETLKALSKKKSKRQFYNFDTNPSAKWTLPILYYLNFSDSNFDVVIRSAINIIESSTCISFTKSSTPPQEPHIVFNRFAQGCVSFVGRSDKLASPIYGDDSCFERPGTVMYLIVQTLGLWHQTQRPDATDNVRILKENLDQSHWADFIPVSSEYVITLGYPYDYASLTHYGGKVFSKNGQVTIETLDPLYQQTIGQKVELSFQDTKLLNHFYCKDRCILDLDCMNGGYTDISNCSLCVCPDGFQGIRCELFRVYQKTSLETGDCGDELSATFEERELVSPGYSRNFYPAYTQCKWIISAPQGRLISLKFIDNFNLYSDELDACQHWVEIRYKPPFIYTGPRFCGQKLPTININSTSNKVLIIFKSNDIGIVLAPQKGFKLQYKLITNNQESCTPNPCLNDGTCTVKESNYTCSCTPKFYGDQCQVEFENSTDPCFGNPCRNQGKCQVTGTTFSCICIKPFYGEECQHACCGGCDTTPGLICDKKCSIVPVNCTMNSISRVWWNFMNLFKYHLQACEDIQSICCDNAAEVNKRCAALGWTKWSKCSSDCGSGQQMRYKYGLQDGVYKIVETEPKNCTGESCRKSRRPSLGWC